MGGRVVSVRMLIGRPRTFGVTTLFSLLAQYQALQHDLAEGVREGVHSLSETVHHLHEGLAERMHSLQGGLSETVHSLQERVQHLPGVAAALEALSNVLCWPTPR